MRISVAMAVYNGEKYIMEQLISIADQTRIPDELIISDDNSTDKTMLLVEEFRNKYRHLSMTIKVVKNKPQRAGATLNFENAIKNTTGDIIFLCDQDDIWTQDKVQRISEIMEKHNENVVFHDAKILKQVKDNSFELTEKTIFRDGNELYDKPFLEDGTYKIEKEKYLWLCHKYNLINGMCMCIRRDYLFSILPFSKGGLHDAWICFCAIIDDTLLSVKDILSYYRIHRTNTTQIRGQKKKKNYLKSLITYDKRSQANIRSRYIWYIDRFLYASEDLGELNEFMRGLHFYTVTRLDLLKRFKVVAIFKALSEYKKGSYLPEGRALLCHDLLFILLHSVSFRRIFVNSIDAGARISDSRNILYKIGIN